MNADAYKRTDTTVHSLYALSQPGGLLSLREYLLTDVGGERVLLLRWVKEADVSIDSMIFEVIMMDAVGSELGRRTVTYEVSDIPPAEKGHLFAPERGIPVDSGCMEVRVNLIEVRSGSYVYRMGANTVTVDYLPEEPWVYDPRAGEQEKLTDSRGLRVRSKRRGKVHFLWLAALLTVLLILFSILSPYLPEENPTYHVYAGVTLSDTV